MVTEPLVFRDLAYVFAAAVLGGGLAWLARQPLILGYVLGGILVGTFGAYAVRNLFAARGWLFERQQDGTVTPRPLTGLREVLRRRP